MCCALLIARGYSEIECSNNVDASVRGILINVLNKKCSSLDGSSAKFSDDNYDCELGEKAFSGEPSGPGGLYSFDGDSNFNGNWETSLTEAVNDADKIDPSTYLNRVTVMCGLPVNKIGCSIEPTEPEIAEMFHLRCNYE
ncbi:hypothetical protein V3C99_014254 [Haemonchus contortus]